ncbi:ABC transporter permease [Aestuariivirga sp. YIM B02566]|uniref:ABC transporter permease n=1 Tax=Taklimakanibacter albus TaxID=2800327 RepID=A0ACC5R759_9HYPH|nr:ABC transporter permease [Aestuariivirga sp. YIM B02566]MBK1868504.1 ABC transporter permease [Aestuariivirga sp. YIM B02566]
MTAASTPWRFVTPIWPVLAVLVIGAALLSGPFLSPANIAAVLQQGVITGIVALGMTIVLIGGQFDLSTGATVMMAAVLALLLNPADGTSTVLAILLPVALGGVIGLVNGLAVYRAGANSIVATIGMQFLVIGAVLALVSGQHVRADNMSEMFVSLSRARFLGIPYSVYIFLGLVVALSIIMSNTVFGRHVYALGGDIEAARRAGVKVVRTGIATYMISGMLAALAGVLIASLVGNLDPTAIRGYEFPALTAVVLGGTSLTGGVGRPADTAAAIWVIAVITNVMTILNYQYPVQLLVQGVVLTAAVAFYSWQRARS